ncbi:hypothetical protein GCWU000246_01829 [Jonquetella anthropi E3_33 E1]|nr:hypothetical protein GCWU000246_01829 [Jonquetella anthropi E3_33 E1]
MLRTTIRAAANGRRGNDLPKRALFLGSKILKWRWRGRAPNTTVRAPLRAISSARG